MEPSMQQMAQGGPPPEEQAMQPEGGQPAPSNKPEGDESSDIAEMEKGVKAVSTVLFKEQGPADAFVKMLKPDDPVGSCVRASISLVTEIDNQLNLSERVMAPLAVFGAGELMEIGEAAHGMTFDEKTQKQIVTATWEGIMAAYGVAGEDAANFAGSTSEEEQNAAVQDYQGVM